MSKRKNERSWKQLMRQRERARNGGDARRSGFAFREPILDDYYGNDDELDDYDDEDELEGSEYDNEIDGYDSEDIRDSVPRQSTLS